jgi:hypothetical protein
MDFLFGYTDKIGRKRSRKKSKIELKKEFDTGENILWDGQQISEKQLALIKSQIDFILKRSV